MSKRILLGLDFGASSGRAMVGVFDGEKLTLDEVHRFANEPVMTEQYFYWDTLRLFHEMKEGIRKAVRKYGRIDSIGIDTWGVDYALVAKGGEMLTNPIHYRDFRTEESIPQVHSIISFEKLFEKTGLAFQTFNSIYQLYAEKMRRPELYDLADKILYTPDFLAYLLTGKMYNEYTIASTGGLVNAVTGEYDPEIVEALGLGMDKFPPIIKPGTVIGHLSDYLCQELDIPSIPVIAVCTHDTASAVAAIPFDEDVNSAYISSGTWSLLGIETDAAVCTDEARDEGFTNEGGAFGKFVLLKNITGLWLMQNLRREWGNRHEKLSYDDIEKQARKAKSEGKTFAINPNDPAFNNPVSMMDAISDHCEQSGQGRPEGVGEIALGIYNGLANEYRNSVRGLEVITGEKIEQLNIVGGGIQDKFLSELTAAALEIPVVAGPIEASVTGNFLMQLAGFGDIKSLAQGREIVKNSFEVKRFA